MMLEGIEADDVDLKPRWSPKLSPLHGAEIAPSISFP